MNKQKNWIIIAVVAIVVLLGVYLSRNNTTVQQNNTNDGSVTKTEKISYQEISSQELEDMLPNKDFTLIDVHIPEQVHIPKTDFMAPYNEIDELVEVLPDKNAKIVLYCRSGGMSAVAAQALVDRGYTNVLNLTNGMNEWQAENRATTPKGSVPARPSDQELAYIALGPGNKVAIIDINTGEVVTNSLPAGNNPHGIAVTDKYIFTSSSKMGPKEMLMEPDHDDGEPMDIKKMMSLGSNIITVTDKQGNIVKKIDVGGGSHHMAITPDKNKVIASIPSQSGVVIIDTKTLEKSNFIKTGKISNYITVSPDGKFAYVSNKGEDTISVINLNTEKLITNIKTGLRPDHIAINNNGSFIYVTNGGDDTVNIISTKDNQLTNTIKVGESPHGISASPDGKKLYVANSESKTVSVIDLSTNKLVDTIPVDNEIAHLEVVPDGTKLLVNSEVAQSIYVIDTTTNKIINTIKLNQEPHQIAF